MQAIASLLAGPRAPSSKKLPLLACLPLVILCGLMLAVCVAGLVHVSPDAALAWARRTVPLAGGATLACLLLAAVPVASGAGAFWLLPLWLAPSVGVLGWSLLPLPGGPLAEVAGAAVLTLPLMVLLLAGQWAGRPAGLAGTAARLGAPPTARLALALRLGFPGALHACLVVFAVSLVLIGAGA